MHVLLFALGTLAFIGVGLLLSNSPLYAQGVPPTAPASASTNRSLDWGHLSMVMGLVALLTLLHAFLATAEIALITIRRMRLRQLVEEGNRRAHLVEKLLAEPARLMATIQTSVMLVAMFAAAIAAISVVPPVAEWLRTLPNPFFANGSMAVALAMVMLPVAVLSLILGGITPKSLAVHHAERLALVAAYPVYLLEKLLAPAVALVTLLSNLILRPFGGTASFMTPTVNEEELKMMVEASEEQGVLEAEETEMIHSILDFSDTVVRKVMTPRIDMTGVDVTVTLGDLVRQIHDSGHSRIPVYENDLDYIIGIVHAKDLLHLSLDSSLNEVAIRDVMRPPFFIPETKKVDELLSDFRRTRQQLAIVRDEYGTTAGLVTIEDLVEEIVGDIQDEYDQDEPMVQVVDAHTTVFDGKTGLDDVNERMGLEIPEDEADTIGGFVFGLLGHQAEQGEKVFWQNVEFMVEATDGRRITKVRLIHHPDTIAQEPPPPDDAAPLSGGNGEARPTVSRPLEISGVETAPRYFFRR